MDMVSIWYRKETRSATYLFIELEAVTRSHTDPPAFNGCHTLVDRAPVPVTWTTDETIGEALASRRVE